MISKSEFKEKIRKRTRLEILKSWMTSFVITTAAVIVAVVTIPSSPKAEFKQVQVFKNQIVYQVEVTDADNAIDLDTLEIVLENQFEYYSIPLTLGMNVGDFSNLNDGTTYQMTVMGSKGFGQEKLATQAIVTKRNSGGAILSYTLLETQDQFDIQYELETILYDELDEYMNVELYYGVIGVDETVPFNYYNSTVTDGTSNHLLENIYATNGQIHVYLEATLNNNDHLILDELFINLPLSFEVYYYIDQVTDTSIVLSMYLEYIFIEDATYEYILTKDGYPISTKLINYHDFDETLMHDGISITFDDLKKNTIYQIEVKASYTNPYTLAKETKIFEPMEIKTLSAYSYNMSIVDYDSYYEVTINVTDPSHNFQIPYVYIYETQDEFDWLVYSAQFGFTPMDGYKTVTFTISKSMNVPYRIDIGLRNESTSYYYQVIHVIISIE